MKRRHGILTVAILGLLLPGCMIPMRDAGASAPIKGAKPSGPAIGIDLGLRAAFWLVEQVAKADEKKREQAQQEA